jgi:hypothetical protein
MDCDECDRLAAAEAQATIDLVTAAEDLKASPEAEWLTRSRRVEEAEQLLFEARRRLDAHKQTHV